ncbi:MAG: hypothetical protein KBG28_15765 [Kofleriaceae bacterium]|jgi:hypothetical protein|nr:hypothetical protein [Kofleriaceae bacterium]MBP9205428.1 hypothetical protein [Kofleriaceae bacterium]
MSAGLVAHLPAPLAAALGALDRGWPGEAGADCARCPMQAAPAPHPWRFSADSKCCTAHPTLANFLVGRALADPASASAALVHARLSDPAGVGPLGLDPPPAYDARYRRDADGGFGQDQSLRCPFWVGGADSCGVWAVRSATCRTWFCRHDHGLHGAAAWGQASFWVSGLEQRLAELCAARVGPPGPDPDWADYFVRCAAASERLDLADVDALLTPALRVALDEVLVVRAAATERAATWAPLPARLQPALSEWHQLDDGQVVVTGYSTFDAVVAPAGFFGFLAELGGDGDWRRARAAVRRARADAAWLDDDTVAGLVRVGALVAPDTPPPPVELVALRRWTRRGHTP